MVYLPASDNTLREQAGTYIEECITTVHRPQKTGMLGSRKKSVGGTGKNLL